MVRPNELYPGMIYKLVIRCDDPDHVCVHHVEGLPHATLLRLDTLVEGEVGWAGFWVECPTGSYKFPQKMRITLRHDHVQFCFSRQWMEKIQ